MPNKEEDGIIRVLFASAEAEPFYKIGGLGDYSGSLPNALEGQTTKNNHKIDIRVVLPLHDPATIKKFSLHEEFAITLNSKSCKATGRVFTSKSNGIVYYFIQQLHPKIDSANVYASNEYVNSLKFAFFSLACIKMLDQIDWHPDILHANDWHSALIIHQLNDLRILNKKRNKFQTLLVIHNMPFMGNGSEKVFQDFMIHPTTDTDIPKWAQHLPLPMGIAAADKIVAVSPTYAEELKTNYFAYGLENYFIKYSDKLSGIINGINTDIWDPSKDMNLTHNFSVQSIEKRNKNKIELIKELGLNKDPDLPLLVVISRLENQKGIDLLLDGLLLIEDEKWNAVILGTGHHGYEHAFRALEREKPKKIRALMEYNSCLASKLYASGDMILMPSLYEPCGLSQMIAMRYGCIPIAHAVGGLKDSIFIKPESARTGFLFNDPNPNAFINCIKDAFSKYRQAEKWSSVQMNAMQMDYSWDNSAKKYADLYDNLFSANYS
ncbi:MAG: glycogen/starch synthase [Pelolinea sp.]|nr:glycogen/starch synthase [Pelolinea sp.]